MISSTYKKGFTLTELLVTLAIIGILTAVVLAGLDLIKKQGYDAKRISDVKQLQKAIESYFDTCASFPQNLNVLGAATSDCPSYKPVLTEIPVDPKEGTPYSYYLGSNPVRFHLCTTKLEYSYGNNPGKAGTAPFSQQDMCDGRSGNTFDVVGGAY